MCYRCCALGELSDEYQTDYDEEIVDSALSDFEAFPPGSEHTEGEETGETVCRNATFTLQEKEAQLRLFLNQIIYV